MVSRSAKVGEGVDDFEALFLWCLSGPKAGVHNIHCMLLENVRLLVLGQRTHCTCARPSLPILLRLAVEEPGREGSLHKLLVSLLTVQWCFSKTFTCGCS